MTRMPGPAAVESADRPRMLCDAHAVVAAMTAATEGVLWRLGEPDRQFDAQLMHLPTGGGTGRCTDVDRDVLLIVVSGSGVLATEDGCLPLGVGTVVWLPRGAIRRLRAASAGLAYLTVRSRHAGSASVPCGDGE